jgi:eukaryotic-like serine/threonine-protein kinase
VKKPTPFGKYYLLERINIGGMAEVFRAKAFGVEGFERLVAVKRILPNIAEDKEFIRMFIEEAKLSVQLNHANIAQIFDLGVVEGSYYIALEHVHGRDLRVLFDRCRQLGEAMPVAQACFVAMKVCEGLDYAHNKRDQAGRDLALVHRDVSPQNILVSFEGEVKLIDFGIAKAAGTDPNAQGGVLKGKFGYMSPEQVRGQDVDRRSDVFSCGIVLYELLTGERLFVGESDFSTLEKVRNVEILPPSTYNRKIPDELERIVLKALSKDAEDRYQNAIDLHDELQAFVYTAGEFYSRKDLAAWMKKTFGKEIEDETAKLESYRQLKPPPPAPPPPIAVAPSPDAALPEATRAQPTQSARPPRKPTQPVPVSRAGRSTTGPVAAIKPPPAPGRSQPVAVVPPLAGSGPVASAAPVVSGSPTSGPIGLTGISGGISGGGSGAVAMAAAAAPVPAAAAPAGRPVDLGWEDDELETRVYDGDDQRHKPQRAALPLQPPVSSSPGIPLPLDAGGTHREGASVEGAGWGAASTGDPFPSLSPAPGSGAIRHHHNGAGGAGDAGAAGAPGGAGVAPGAFPASSQDLGPPLIPDLPVRSDRGDAMQPRRELSGPQRALSTTFPPPDQPTIPVSSFGARITGARRPGGTHRMVTAAIGGVAVLVVAAVVIIASSGKAKPTPQPAPAPVAVRPAPPPPEPNTGFDLYVTPAGIMQWKLDGESRTDRLPSRIRGIAPGPHTVQIDPPPGFLSQLEQVAVEAGKAHKVEIALQPIPGMSGVFESTPPGATVSLIVDGKRQTVGPSPAKAPLDPRSAYQVLFEKQGYVSVNRPITFTGALEEHVVVNLEKVAAPPPAPTQSAPPAPPPPPSRPAPAAERPRKVNRPASAQSEPPAGDAAASDDTADAKDARDAKADKSEVRSDARADKPRPLGVLVLGSKPPCDIAIDGVATTLHTPQKEIKLAVGKHRITLTNSEFGINETFTVDIKPDAPEKLIKDYSDRLPN